MRVVVTGGCGFIGRQVVTQLVERGHDIRVLATRAARSGADVTVGEVRDPEVVRRLVRDADVVCISRRRWDWAWTCKTPRTTPMATFAAPPPFSPRWRSTASIGSCSPVRWSCMARGSVSAPNAVTPDPRAEDDLRAGRFDPGCPQCGRRLGPAMIDEDSRLDPRNAYAASKLAQEHFASSWARAVSASVASLRYHNVYGPGMPKDTPVRRGRGDLSVSIGA